MRVRNKLACKIAGLNPDRFNETIAAGQYGCAPHTAAGSARIYEADDVVCLCIFKMLTDAGMSAARAGHYACEAKYQMTSEGVTHVSVLHTFAGANFTIGRRLGADEAIQPSGPKPLEITFDIEALRNYVAATLKYEDENRIIGEE